MKVFVFLIAFLTLAMPAAAMAQDGAPVGTLAETEGSVTLIRVGEVPRPLSVDDEIYLNDVVETGDESRAHILFIDDTELTLGANTHMAIDDYVFDEDNPSGNSGKFNFLRGTFIFVSGLITKLSAPDVTLETAYGSIGIRGTTVWGGDIDNEYGVFVADGEVSVKTRRGQVRVRTGEGTSMTGRNARPGRAQKWGEAKIERAKQMVRLARAEEVKKRVERLRQRHQSLRERHRKSIKKRRDIQQDIERRDRQDYRDRRRDQRREIRPRRP